MTDLVTRRLRTASALRGPLLFVRGARRARLGEIVRIRAGDEERRGQVIEVSEELAAIQVLEETRGIAPDRTEVILSGEVATLPVSRAMLGRTFDGTGRPADGHPAPVPEALAPVNGAPMNVTRRAKPSEFIETGVSAIDGLNTLVRGQKLPIFSCAGLPASPWHAAAETYAPRGPGSVLAFEIKGGVEAGKRFVDALELHSHVANIGDVRSLVIHPASTTHQQLSAEEQLATGVTPGLVRLAVGLEGIDDILADLERGFAGVRA